MGILHSVNRFLGCKTKDEEGGGCKSPIYPYLLPRRQTYYNNLYDCDSSDRFKILIFGSSIWNAVKVLLHKLRLALNLVPRPRKVTTDPVLPIQNPESSKISTEPLLIHTTLISGSDTFTSVAADLSTNDQELLCENADVLSCQQWRLEENNSNNMKLQRDDMIVSIPDFACSLAHSSVSDEIMCSAVLIQENPPGNVVPFPEERIIGDKSIEDEIMCSAHALIQENPPMNVVPFPKERIIGDKSIEDEIMCSAHALIQENPPMNVVPFPKERIIGDKSIEDEIMCSAHVLIQENPPRNVVHFSEERIIGDKSIEEEEEENVKIKSIFVVGEERWIKHYSSRHRILLVGEGDFSFSACLAVAFGRASNVIATSLDPAAFLKKNYRRASSNIEKLRNRKSKVMHGVDATELMNHALIGHLKFDRIIFNFPYAGLNSLKNLPRESQLRLHRRLVSLFLKNAREMISENGEIHISHKINGFHVEFNLESIASSHRLRLIEAVNFDCLDYPGYKTKYGFGGDNNFNCNPSNTYKFGLKRIQH